MSLQTIREELTKQTRSLDTIIQFDEVKKHHEALSDFEDINSLIKFMRKPNKCLEQSQSKIASSLLIEFQRKQHTCWGSILLLAFFPFLSQIYGSALRVSYDNEYVEFLIYEIFLDIADKFSVAKSGKIAVIHLTLSTQREVYRHLKRISKKEQFEDTLEEHENDFCHIDYSVPSANAKLADSKKMLSQVERYLEKFEFDQKERELVFDTTFKNTRIIDWVRKYNHKVSKKKFNKIYQQARKQKSRFYEQLRDECGINVIKPQNTVTH